MPRAGGRPQTTADGRRRLAIGGPWLAVVHHWQEHQVARLESETPSSPAQPKPLQDIAIASVLGLMVGVLGAFAAEYFTQPRPPRAT